MSKEYAGTTRNDEDVELDEPQSCPCCNVHPAFDEIADGQFECRNCGAVIRADGTVLEEGEEPSPDTEDDLWDDSE